jgi:DNA-binding response OmpR family regulator
MTSSPHVTDPAIIVVSHGETDRRTITRILAGAGFAPIGVGSLHEIDQAADGKAPLAIVADLGREAGLEPRVVRNSISAYFNLPIEVPVIAIIPECCADLGTAALAGGAIDVLFRPLVERELLIRLRSVVKRWQVAMTRAPSTDGKLTLVESKILTRLEAQCGRSVANEELIDHLGGVHNIARLRLLIASLRRKLHVHAPTKSIATIRGVGYSLIVD